MDLAMTREKALGSFSFDVAKRMLDVLREHGTAMKKTTLASRAGLNYNVCLRYIRMLNSLGWIEVNPEVSITEAGKVAFAKFLDESRASDIGVHYVLSSNTKDKSVEHPSSYDILSSTTTIAHRMSQSSSILNVIQQPLLGSKKKTYSRNNNTIMVVDDEQDIAQTYKLFLSSIGYEVRTFTDARSALQEYISDPFLYDLLILDIRMPDINGLQLYQSIRAINPECKAIFVSALDAAKEVVSVLPGMKPQKIIHKPVSKEQFVLAVKTALIQ